MSKVDEINVNIQNDSSDEICEGYIGTYWEIPEGLRENQFIHGGYRIGF